MTVEVAILNRSAAAIAADSALTTGLPGKEKVFFGASKIFTLSRVNPIGIMIYGGANYFSVPWETVIKSYRSQLKNKTFSTVKNAKDDFVKYLGNKKFLTEKDQQLYIFIATLSTLGSIINERRKTKSKNNVSENRKIVDKLIQRAMAYDQLDDFSDLTYAKFHSEYGSIIESFLTSDEFEKITVPKSLFPKVKSHIFFSIKSQLDTTLSSGIVIVGFGEDELFPSLNEVKVDGGIFDRVRVIEGRAVDIGRGAEPVAVEAFAQEDVVESFVHGFDEKYKKRVLRNLRGFLDAQIEDVLDNHTMYNDDEKKVVRASQKGSIGDAVDQFEQDLDEFAAKKYTGPAFDVLANATKDELADFAEALVNITSMKRRVSVGTETVGGDVDVALISKGDGFVWIKRKHYFDRNLNHHFFANYFRPEGE